MSTAPWKKRAPERAAKTKLTAASVTWARARAKAAGRRYPNLVDNMAAARRQREQATGSAGGTPARGDHP